MTVGAILKAVTATPTMIYRDPDAAISYLVRAFGFDEHAVHRDGDGNVIHAELTFGKGMIMIGPEDKGEFGNTLMAMPKEVGGRCTQTVYCVVSDVDAHHDRAVAAGAEVVMALKDENYGGRDYAVRGPEGQIWSFGTYDPWSAKNSNDRDPGAED